MYTTGSHSHTLPRNWQECIHEVRIVEFAELSGEKFRESMRYHSIILGFTVTSGYKEQYIPSQPR